MGKIKRAEVVQYPFRIKAKSYGMPVNIKV
jgi:hypothetical protein